MRHIFFISETLTAYIHIWFTTTESEFFRVCLNSQSQSCTRETYLSVYEFLFSRMMSGYRFTDSLCECPYVAKRWETCPSPRPPTRQVEPVIYELN